MRAPTPVDGSSIATELLRAREENTQRALYSGTPVLASAFFTHSLRAFRNFTRFFTYPLRAFFTPIRHHVFLPRFTRFFVFPRLHVQRKKERKALGRVR